MELGRDGVVVRAGCADTRVDGRVAEVGVPVLEGPPEGGCGVDEGDNLGTP